MNADVIGKPPDANPVPTSLAILFLVMAAGFAFSAAYYMACAVRGVRAGADLAVSGRLVNASHSLGVLAPTWLLATGVGRWITSTPPSKLAAPVFVGLLGLWSLGLIASRPVRIVEHARNARRRRIEGKAPAKFLLTPVELVTIAMILGFIMFVVLLVVVSYEMYRTAGTFALVDVSGHSTSRGNWFIGSMCGYVGVVIALGWMLFRARKRRTAYERHRLSHGDQIDAERLILTYNDLEGN